MDADLLQGFYLKDFLVEPAAGQITGRGGTTHLPPKAAEVLLRLASEPGELVTREALIEEVWGEGHGSRDALSHAVSEIRHALDDHHDDPEFIQTLPRRGYRLLTQPEIVAGATSTVVLGAEGGPKVHEIGLFENLSRRGVLETAIAYLILGWLIIQVADIVFDDLGIPWPSRYVTMFVIAGFPVAIVLSWFLEWRDGRAVVHELTARDLRKKRFSRTYLSVIGALVIAAIGVSIVGPEIEIVGDIEEPILPPITENTIAVLPFKNIDGSDETQVFANGLVDDVITRLTSVPGLRVSARGESLTLEPDTPAEDVRQRLQVAQYIEGGVQIDGDAIRVTIQLIDSSDGSHMAARTFDRPRDDFFAIRDEITNLVVSTVRVSLPAGTRTALVYPDDPSLDAYLLYRRGVDASRESDTEKSNAALGWFDAALDIDLEYAAAHAGRCRFFVGAYRSSADTANINLAEDACATALALNPNLDVVNTALGDLYVATGRYDDAVAEYLRALEKDRENISALAGLGGVYGLIGKPELAEESLRKAVDSHPGNWSAYNSLGEFLFNSGQYAEAAEQYEIVVALDRGNAIGYANLGAAHMMAGDFTSARRPLERSIDIEPLPAASNTLGIIFYYFGELNEAADAQRRAIELMPNNTLYWLNLGDVLWIAGRPVDAQEAYAEAERLAEGALEVNPNDPFSLMDLAWASAMQNDLQRARELIDAASAQAPEDPYADYYDGLIALREGNAEAAIAALSDAADKGYPRSQIGAEPLLADLRENPDFQAIVQ